MPVFEARLVAGLMLVWVRWLMLQRLGGTTGLVL